MTKKTQRIGGLDIWRELGAATDEPSSRVFKEARWVDLGLISPHAAQPRQSFDPASLQELAASIQQYGLLQPIVVRPDGERFVIIAGQRRYEACRLLGLAQMPVVIREASEQEAIEQALVENIQREDINPVEEATCYQALMDEHGYSIRDMAARMHKSVGYIHGRLELLKHEDIADSVQTGTLGIFEARELAKVADPAVRAQLMQQVLAGELDREGLRRAVQRLAPDQGSSQEFRPEVLTKRWTRFRREFVGLEAATLDKAGREQTRQVLEGMKQEIDALLKQLKR